LFITAAGGEPSKFCRRTFLQSSSGFDSRRAVQDGLPSAKERQQQQQQQQQQ
jgi:hypothetical protein